MRLMVVLTSRSKHYHKVKELLKNPQNIKSLNRCKVHQFREMFIKAPMLRQRTRASVRILIVFQTFFARPRSSLNTTFTSIIIKTKLGFALFLSEEPVFFESLCIKFLSAKLASSFRLILEMRLGSKRPSFWLRQKCLMAGRLSRKLCIYKVS